MDKQACRELAQDLRDFLDSYNSYPGHARQRLVEDLRSSPCAASRQVGQELRFLSSAPDEPTCEDD